MVLYTPGWSTATTLGLGTKNPSTLKALGMCGHNPFRVQTDDGPVHPGLSLRSNPGLKLANAFGVICSNFSNDALLAQA